MWRVSPGLSVYKGYETLVYQGFFLFPSLKQKRSRAGLAEVPDSLKDKVCQMLNDLDMGELAGE